MIVFQLVAKGPLAMFNGRATISSRIVYRDRDLAEAAEPAFAIACVTDPESGPSLNTLERVDSITIRELEVVD